MIEDAGGSAYKPTNQEIVIIYRTMLKYGVCAYFLNKRECGDGRFICDGYCSHYGRKMLRGDLRFKPFRTIYEDKRRSV